MSRQPRTSHASPWFSLMLVVMLLIYAVFVWYLERVSIGTWLSQLSPNAAGLRAIVVFLVRFTRHFIPVAVGWWFAYNASVQTVERLYDINDKQEARTFVNRLRSPNIRSRYGTPVTHQSLTEQRDESILLRVGGPGKVSVAASNVIVTEDNGRFLRTLGPGLHLLKPYEYVHTIIDLREQKRTVADVKLLTRDNIELTATFNIVYRVKRGAEQPSKSRPYPYDEEAVRRLAYAQSVGADNKVSDWSGKPVGTTRGILGGLIKSFRLDDIIHPDGQAEEPYRTLQTEVVRKARAALAGDGIELISVHIAQLKPRPEIEAQFIKYWQSQWETKDRLNKADGAALATEELEIARAEAEVAMMQAILEGIQRARRSGATTRTSEVVALRLVEGLERMAEGSRHTQPSLTPTLDKLRNELHASTLPPGPNGRDGKESTT